MKKALITGITGQTGSYLAEILLKNNYEVHGLIRRSSSFNTKRIEHLYLNKYIKNENNNLKLHYGDMTDTVSLFNIIKQVNPDEIYNLAAQSHVAVSFELPEYTAQVDALGIMRLIEIVLKINKKIKIYQASTSELFGGIQEEKQSEITPFNPKSPYGAAKLYAYWITKIYRESYKMFISNGILFNHESERRGDNFVTQKIIKSAIRIKKGEQEKLILGNIDTYRDWGYAKDYAEMIFKILQKDKPDDYVISTGKTYSVRQFIEIVFKKLNINIIWKGKGLKEKGINSDNNKIIIKIDKKYFRPNEVKYLCGDCSKAINELNWNPNKTNLEDLIDIMIKGYENE